MLCCTGFWRLYLLGKITLRLHPSIRRGKSFRKCHELIDISLDLLADVSLQLLFVIFDLLFHFIFGSDMDFDHFTEILAHLLLICDFCYFLNFSMHWYIYFLLILLVHIQRQPLYMSFSHSCSFFHSSLYQLFLHF